MYPIALSSRRHSGFFTLSSGLKQHRGPHKMAPVQPVPSDGSLDGSPPSVSAHVEWVQHRDGVEITRADGVTIDGGSKS